MNSGRGKKLFSLYAGNGYVANQSILRVLGQYACHSSCVGISVSRPGSVCVSASRSGGV